MIDDFYFEWFSLFGSQVSRKEFLFSSLVTQTLLSHPTCHFSTRFHSFQLYISAHHCNYLTNSPTSLSNFAMEEAGEFHDWELLHNSETGLLPPLPPSPDASSKDFVEIEGVSEGLIRSDYFASDSQKRHAVTVHGAVDVDSSGEEGSVSSENPSWIEPREESQRKNSTEFWSDSSSDERSLDKVANLEGKQEVGFEGIREIEAFEEGNEELGGFGGVAEEEETVNPVLGVGEETADETALGDGEEVADETMAIVAEEGIVSSEVSHDDGEKKGMVWWKVPFEILKFCLFKVSPGWSIAVAAAVMGIVILRRRLHKMKRKSRSIPLKITVEDKKVSQFMKNAARLNEAFSVVRRVPIIRPLLPAPGLNQWPVMNLR